MLLLATLDHLVQKWHLDLKESHKTIEKYTFLAVVKQFSELVQVHASPWKMHFLKKKIRIATI